MKWQVLIADEFEPEFFALPEDVQTEILRYPGCFNNSARNWGDPASTRRTAPATKI
jgi:hypothetical protein